MTVDWNTVELTFLRGQLELGRVVLFAGAGFSLDATNRSGDPPPLGLRLAQMLAAKAGIPYHNDSLPNVYEAVEPALGANNVWKYLAELYTIEGAANWYEIVSGITWHRIYTTNIDNLFQFLAPLRSQQRLKTIVCKEPPQERDQLFEELQCIHLHGHIEHRLNGLTFTLPDFAKHTVRPDPWYQALVDDIQNCPVIFIGTTLDEPILNHYLELRGQKDSDKREYRPKSYLVSPGISPIKAAALRSRNIVAVDATAKDFFESLLQLGLLPQLNMRSVQCRVYPHHFHPDRSLERAVTAYFDLIVPAALPIGRPVQSRFFLGAEPTWNDIQERRDGDRCVTQLVVDKLLEPSDAMRCVVMVGPAGSGKTTCIMRVAHELACRGKRVFFAHNSQRLDLKGVLELVEKDEKGASRTYIIVDAISQRLGSIASYKEQLMRVERLTLVLVERTNKYATKCQRIAEFNPEIVSMPDLSEPDVKSILTRLDQFGFLGVLKDKAHGEQVRLFMERASRQLLVAMREATSGKEFSLILQGEFEELENAARLAYTICCIAVSRGAPGVYTKHLSPCLPLSTFTKGFIITELLRGVLLPSNEAGSMVKPRHSLIARWIANDIAPLEMRLAALRVFLKQISSHIVPNQIRQRSPAFLAYRGMINSAGLHVLLDGNEAAIIELYDELQPYYSNDSLFWLHYGMAHIDAKNLDIAENYLNQSLALYPNNHQALNHLGILFLIQATESAHAGAMLVKAKEGMVLLEDQMRERGDIDTHPYLSYLTHVTRWYTHAGNLVTEVEWEALRIVAKEARAKHRMDDDVRAAADEVEHAYLRRLTKSSTADLAAR